ncbi:DUF2469 family protein, partial [Rhodococcus hoagii]|nr:DUF2469 family protein [Prescottella equi]
ETEMELSLYREYRDIVGQFSYVVETERPVLSRELCGTAAASADGEIYFEVRCPTRGCGTCTRRPFVKYVRVITFKDVNIEELEKSDLRLPDNGLG